MVTQILQLEMTIKCNFYNVSQRDSDPVRIWRQLYYRDFHRIDNYTQMP